MNNNLPFTPGQLFTFIDKAGKATWAGEGKEVDPERKNFHELEFTEGDFYYRDSYVGNFKSRGMELVRYKGNPVWSALYGGGMVEEKEDMADSTFKFLKKAMSSNEDGFHSFRGPHDYSYGDWMYEYNQKGDIKEFSGSEEIFYKRERVFFHKIIGGYIL